MSTAPGSTEAPPAEGVPGNPGGITQGRPPPNAPPPSEGGGGSGGSCKPKPTCGFPIGKAANAVALMGIGVSH
jgi:hypothetical protein